jgi:hypothetical protein
MALALLAGCGGSSGPSQHEREVARVVKALELEREIGSFTHELQRQSAAATREAEACIAQGNAICAEGRTDIIESNTDSISAQASHLRMLHRQINGYPRSVIEEAMRIAIHGS